MLGAVMATTKKHLAEIGGFESLVDYFCDDYELGNRIAARGHRVELSRFPVDIVYPHETLGDAFRHQLRWNLSIRYSRPWGHFGLIFTQGLPWSLVGAASRALVARRLRICRRATRCCATKWRSARARAACDDPSSKRKLWMLPLRDAFAFVVWLASFFPQRIHWRDRQFYVREQTPRPGSAAPFDAGRSV